MAPDPEERFDPVEDPFETPEFRIGRIAIAAGCVYAVAGAALSALVFFGLAPVVLLGLVLVAAGVLCMSASPLASDFSRSAAALAMLLIPPGFLVSLVGVAGIAMSHWTEGAAVLGFGIALLLAGAVPIVIHDGIAQRFPRPSDRPAWRYSEIRPRGR